MREKNIKGLIILLIVLIIISIIITLVVHMKKNKKRISEEFEGDGFSPDQGTMEEEYDIEKLRNATQFYTVEKCINNYIENQDNEDEEKFTAKEMDVKYGHIIETYRVYGEIEKSNTKEDAYYKVKIDRSNFTFKVEKCNKDIQSLDQISIEKDSKEIIANSKNKLEYVRVSSEELCREYLRCFIMLEQDSPEEAYNLLEENYKKEKFPNLESFKNYIEENKEQIHKTVLSDYQEEYGEEITEYIIRDSYNNYYTIYEESIMNFKIKLEASEKIEDE